MRRAQLEALLKQVHEASGLTQVAMIGSQCIHAVSVAPPAEVLMSEECDVLDEGTDAIAAIRVALGKTSPYHIEHGVYVDTVPATFPFLPAGWEQRARAIDVGVLVARCLEPNDLAISKLAAGRLKDTETVAALIMETLVDVDVVRTRITEIADLHQRAVLLARLQLVLENIEQVQSDRR